MICCGISGNGTTRCRMPFSAQTRGIPYTMQLDLSWPMVIPPSRAMARGKITFSSALKHVCILNSRSSIPSIKSAASARPSAVAKYSSATWRRLPGRSR